MFQVSPSLGRLRLPGRQEHEVELLLNRRVVRCVTSYLMRWRGNSSADDEWLQLEEPAEKVAEYEAAGPGGAPSGRPPGRLLGFHPACRSPAGSLPASRGALPVPACGPVRGRDRLGPRGPRTRRPAWSAVCCGCLAPLCRLARLGEPADPALSDARGAVPPRL